MTCCCHYLPAEHKTDLSHSQPMDIEESVESAVGSVEEKSVPASGERPVASDNKDSMNPFPDIGECWLLSL